jgi:hypothetical protein
VRPPDENQHGSTRPNFMSASRRPSSGEDNILARLERDGKRAAAGKSWKHMNMTIVWCGLASLAVVGLIALLTSLAKENIAAVRKPLVPEAKVSAPNRYVDPDSRSGFAPLPAPPEPPRRAALIVEEPVVPPISKVADMPRVPPMVMLKPAATVPPKPATAPPALRSAPARIAAKSPPARPVRLKVAPHPPARLVAAVPARPNRLAQSALAARPEPAAVDSDVDLLSAIIMHSSRHSGERAQIEAKTCPTGKKCPAPKATD